MTEKEQNEFDVKIQKQLYTKMKQFSDSFVRGHLQAR